MFWWGRVNAIIAILAVVGSVLAVAGGAWEAMVTLWFLVIVLRIALWGLNLVWAAATGDPLFYDTKILARRQRRGDDE